MAARTTATEVKQIIDTDLSDAIVEGFIASATALVDQAVSDDDNFADLSSALLGEIERWLTAHMLASTRVRQLVSGEAGGAKAVYQGKADMGLNATLYGQQVLAMDTTGYFASLGGKKVKLQAVPSWND
jgi:hypothetical protein